jgi:hypothetical protein
MMNYPRNPPGLRWHEHYKMADNLFCAVVDALGIQSPPRTQPDPDPLPEAETPTTRKHVRGNDMRTYRSQYVGVTTHNKRYVSQWGAGGKFKGGVQPLTPEGERAAAVDRAQALGRDYLERRDGQHEPLY